MNVSGEEALRYDAVRLDSFEVVNKGQLIEADDMTGLVKWRDSTGEEKSVTLGQHAIRITYRSTFRR